MIIILMLGVHFLLITIYAYMIMAGISRLRFKHLVLALCFPFIGELCLVASETTSIPAKSPYTKAERHRANSQQKLPVLIPENWKEIILGEENQARLFLMNAIDGAEESKLPEILKTALRSESSEVSHIAAAGLMRLIQRHEDTISSAMQNSHKYPENAQLIAAHIDAIHDYRLSGLPDDSTYGILMETEKELLAKYLHLMPKDLRFLKELEELSDQEVKKNA